MPGDRKSGQPDSQSLVTAHGASGRWFWVRSSIVSTLKWHLILFAVFNTALTAANVALAGGWWAYGPLLITAVLLSVHYLLYKTLIVSASWVDERVEDLNIKSYDRAHIEELKSRLGSTATE